MLDIIFSTKTSHFLYVIYTLNAFQFQQILNNGLFYFHNYIS